MSKPLWVQVLWSECSRFKENELMSFIDFEIRCPEGSNQKRIWSGLLEN